MITCLAEVERSKTQVFTWSGDLPPDTSTHGYARAGIMGEAEEEEFLPGYLCYDIQFQSGVPDMFATSSLPRCRSEEVTFELIKPDLTSM